mmetsp:Transcript_26859/g.75411  ORF Transcript_26859/g.75411 Transcript_26859/m.75411 type:complete len:415 (+) Transcript_26859:730-1974(+)
MIGEWDHILQFPKDAARETMVKVLGGRDFPTFAFGQEGFHPLVVERLPEVVDAVDAFAFFRCGWGIHELAQLNDRLVLGVDGGFDEIGCVHVAFVVIIIIGFGVGTDLGLQLFGGVGWDVGDLHEWLDAQQLHLQAHQESQRAMRPWQGVEEVRIRFGGASDELPVRRHELVLQHGLLEEAELVRVGFQPESGCDATDRDGFHFDLASQRQVAWQQLVRDHSHGDARFASDRHVLFVDVEDVVEVGGGDAVARLLVGRQLGGHAGPVGTRRAHELLPTCLVPFHNLIYDELASIGMPVHGRNVATLVLTERIDDVRLVHPFRKAQRDDDEHQHGSAHGCEDAELERELLAQAWSGVLSDDADKDEGRHVDEHDLGGEGQLREDGSERRSIARCVSSVAAVEVGHRDDRRPVAWN